MSAKISSLLLPVFIIFLSTCILPASSDYGTVKFNETCTHSDDCIDYKMACESDENNDLRCLCSPILYDWNGQLNECTLNSKKLKTWLFRIKNSLQRNEAHGEENNKKFNTAFLILTICSFVIVLALLIFLCFVCIIFGCRIDFTHK